VPVIVVGNITVGGTGKTPMILWLIEHCRAAVCASAWSAVVTAPSRRSCRGGSGRAERRQAGDEPLLIVQRTGVPLMIDPTAAARSRPCWPVNRWT
jgi:tetraacyldisaccharide 4'-kinase